MSPEDNKKLADEFAAATAATIIAIQKLKSVAEAERRAAANNARSGAHQASAVQNDLANAMERCFGIMVKQQNQITVLEKRLAGLEKELSSGPKRFDKPPPIPRSRRSSSE